MFDCECFLFVKCFNLSPFSRKYSIKNLFHFLAFSPEKIEDLIGVFRFLKLIHGADGVTGQEQAGGGEKDHQPARGGGVRARGRRVHKTGCMTKGRRKTGEELRK